MAGKNSTKADVLPGWEALVNGTGTLTKAEGDALGAQYRAAESAEELAVVKTARIAYIVTQRSVADADGKPMTAAALAKHWGVTAARVSQRSATFGLLLLAGVDPSNDRALKAVYAPAEKIRRTSPGKDADQKAWTEHVAEKIRDAAAGDPATLSDRLKATQEALQTEATARRKAAAESGDGSAQTTPETDGSKAARGKADVLAALGAIVADVSENGYALTNGEASQVARYLAQVAVNLGVDLAEVAALAESPVAA